MGGRNGGGMEIAGANVNKKKQEAKNKVVTMPPANGGKELEEDEKGGEKAAAKKGDKKEGKGGSKALRREVNKVVKGRKEKFADKLVDEAEEGDVRCAALVLSLMEKKKKDGEDDDDWDGPGLADLLVPGQWQEKLAAKKAAKEEEEETKAA